MKKMMSDKKTGVGSVKGKQGSTMDFPSEKSGCHMPGSNHKKATLQPGKGNMVEKGGKSY